MAAGIDSDVTVVTPVPIPSHQQVMPTDSPHAAFRLSHDTQASPITLAQND
jgi:hypothetical protein